MIRNLIMKNILLVIISAYPVIATGADNRWVDLGFFDNAKTKKVYVDKESIRTNGKFREIWIMSSKTKNAEKIGKLSKSISNPETVLILSAESDKAKWEIDCEMRSMRKLYQVFYSKENGSGAPLVTLENPEKFEPVIPKSWGEEYFRIACN